MAWKTQKTGATVSVDVDADVDLEDFTEAQLLQGLIDSDWLSEEEAETIKKRAETKEKSEKVVGLPGTQFDETELLNAYEYARRGNRNEAMLHLGRALGRDWYEVLN